MSDVTAIVLAAGKGTRMKSDRPKVLIPLLGKPLIQRVLESLAAVPITEAIIIVGHEAEAVKSAVEGTNWPFTIQWVHQEHQLGTGHALQQVASVLKPTDERTILITCGDMPLIPTERYQALLSTFITTHPALTVATVEAAQPSGYGRLIIDTDKHIQAIVEEKDASPEQRQIRWINTGIYASQWLVLAPYLSQLSNQNAQKEFYLTDVIGLMSHAKQTVQPTFWPSEAEVLGINTRSHLVQASQQLSEWTIERLFTDGVTVLNPASQYIAPEVHIGPDTIVYPNCVLEGAITIGQGCQVGPSTMMRGNIQVGNNCTVMMSLLDRQVSIADASYIGPFAHLRDNVSVGRHVKLGNFVEAKEAIVGDYSNAAHLCYLGDVELGEYVNMGAGSIIANYDPVRDTKTRSHLGDHVKIGCNSVIVSPVVIEERACIAAGSVITDRVAAWDLAIARCRQTTINAWVRSVLDGVSAPKPS